MDSDLRFAILIDADNISDKYIKVILDETANNGIATYKRIYGDWNQPPAGFLEKRASSQFHYPHAAIQLHHREKCYGFCHDH